MKIWKPKSKQHVIFDKDPIEFKMSPFNPKRAR